MADVHLKFGGSTAGRTMHCPVWLALYETLPPAVASSDANLGNTLHDAIEQMLLADEPLDPYSFVGFTAHGVTLTHDHIAHKLEPAWREWLELCERFNVVEYEPEILVRLADDIGGTIDVLCTLKDGRRMLVDFKFGDGVLVDVVGNSQLLFYDMCAIADPDQMDWLAESMNQETAVYVIIQPTERSEHYTHVWEATAASLQAFVLEYAEAARKAQLARPDDLELYGAGPGCRFCPCKAVCPLKLGVVEKALRLDPVPLEKLSAAMAMVDDIERWCKAVRTMAHEQMDRGDKVEGFKLVNKRPTRRWTDEEAVEKLVKNSRKIKAAEAHKSTLLSPAQMEKLFKEHGVDFSRLSEYVASVSTGTTVAPESDPRPEAVSVKALKNLADRAAG